VIALKDFWTRISLERCCSPRPEVETEHGGIDAHQQDVAQRPRSIEGFAAALVAVFFAKNKLDNFDKY